MKWLFIYELLPPFTLSLPVLGVLDTDKNATAKINYCLFSLDNPNPNMVTQYPFWKDCIQSKNNWLTWHSKLKKKKNPKWGPLKTYLSLQHPEFLWGHYFSFRLSFFEHFTIVHFIQVSVLLLMLLLLPGMNFLCYPGEILIICESLAFCNLSAKQKQLFHRLSSLSLFFPIPLEEHLQFPLLLCLPASGKQLIIPSSNLRTQYST